MLNKEHQILIIAKNTNGIVARIMSLFNRRGYFVKKMSAGVTNKEGYARLTLTVDGDKESLDQIQKQVYKIIDVVKVKIFPEKDVIRRELMLLKVKADEETRSQIVQIANIYRGNILDVSPKSLVIELTGDIEKLRGFIGMMSNYGILEIAKTGIVAMSRGEKM
ncbi:MULTISPECIES: acetolactate synthase small subunit [Fusobacterium]|jgi:acetolactate synthase, small subunit|uniref:Acetolactate synthase small subunit n=1 Tax=Fusobacterium periodonticum 1_1_41FAA TaxID=469621 RepID=D6LDS8_9FUSO|nr:MULTISPECIES: acetolactate synthase small subunit [Fusobacterium]ATV68449.1 acetolactate synthase small subunit [Fusobacterium pseudoperiodonticum]EFG29463.1 acetolactate synthase, small subunit [Fusobacterium periodonticum 1_1_41FAA]MDU5803753.1 acetolactate synthase small subunit [Fusobacterium periodonticum]